MWTILTVIAIALLAISFFSKGQSSIWGGIFIGGFVGLVIAVISLIRGSGFYFTTIGKGIVVGVICGGVAELLGKISDRQKKKQTFHT